MIELFLMTDAFVVRILMKLASFFDFFRQHFTINESANLIQPQL